jgi:hypothetical protein
MCVTDTMSQCNGFTDSEIRCNNYDHKGPREKYIVTCMSDYRRGLGWRLDLFNTLTHDSLLHLIITASLISTLYKSLQHTLSLFIPLCLQQSLPGSGL